MVEVKAGSQTQTDKPDIQANVPVPHYPDPNAPKTEKAAATLATVSSEVDPMPHIFMASACTVGAGYAYQYLRQPRTAAIAAAIAAGYAGAAYMINNNQVHTGYYIASLASIGLLAATGPKAYAIKDPYHVSLASLGAISTVGNTLKTYQIKTGKPREYNMRK
ncbi:hypothetical protein G9A89_012478 [Geosiphon pyriformis]|nr:hypothetical protein G9A89_012478 [Geosiphon pyriformis]